MAAAQAAVNQQRFQEALEAVEQLRALAPDVAGLEQLARTATDGLKAQRAAEEARRQAEIARQEMDKTLARAAKRLRRRDYRPLSASSTKSWRATVSIPRRCRFAPRFSTQSRKKRSTRSRDFSLWPTLSSATVWLRTKAIYSNTFRITSVLVLAAAVAVGVWRGPADPPQSVESTPDAAPAPTGNPSPTVSPAPITPPTKGVDVGPMVVDARRHLGKGDLVAAARAIVPALTAAPENPDVLKTREEILGAAENRRAMPPRRLPILLALRVSANTATPPSTFSRQPPRDVRAVPKTSSRPFASTRTQQSCTRRRFRPRSMSLKL